MNDVAPDGEGSEEPSDEEIEREETADGAAINFLSIFREQNGDGDENDDADGID